MKFLLTIFAIFVLLRHMEVVSRMARIAAAAAFSGADFRALQIQLLIHPSGGLLVLLAAMTLSLLKPWGITPYGRRRTSQADFPSRPSRAATLVREPELVTSRPRWTRMVGIHAAHAAVIVLLFVVILHLTGGGLRHH